MSLTMSAESDTLVELTMSQAINRALVEALERDEPIVHLGQDLGAYGGTFGVTRGLWERFGPEVMRDGPLCESGTVGSACEWRDGCGCWGGCDGFWRAGVDGPGWTGRGVVLLPIRAERPV